MGSIQLPAESDHLAPPWPATGEGDDKVDEALFQRSSVPYSAALILYGSPLALILWKAQHEILECHVCTVACITVRHARVIHQVQQERADCKPWECLRQDIHVADTDGKVHVVISATGGADEDWDVYDQAADTTLVSLERERDSERLGLVTDLGRYRDSDYTLA